MKKIARPDYTEHAMYYEQYINVIKEFIVLNHELKITK